MERVYGLVHLGAGIALVLSVIAWRILFLGPDPSPVVTLAGSLLLLTGGVAGALGVALWVLWPISKYASTASD